MTNPSKLSELLISLVPQDDDELSVLQQVMACALYFQQKAFLSLGPLGRESAISMANLSSRAEGLSDEFTKVLSSIPEQASRYFHGLIEAMDVYQSIHGIAVPIATLSARDRSLQELKQIRDMCLDEERRAIYW